MPFARTDLLEFLKTNAIAQETVTHPPFFTVEDGRAFKQTMPGGHSKNLFVKDKKGALFLAVAHCDTAVDLVGLGRALGAKGRLSFGKPDLMEATLGVTPGSVTPFSLINENAQALTKVIVDKALFNFDKVWFHPLENTASTGIRPTDLIKFITLQGFEPVAMDLARPAPSPAQQS